MQQALPDIPRLFAIGFVVTGAVVAAVMSSYDKSNLWEISTDETFDIIEDANMYYARKGTEQWIHDRHRIDFVNFPSDMLGYQYVEYHMQWCKPYCCQTLLNQIWQRLNARVKSRGEIVLSCSEEMIQCQVFFHNNHKIELRHIFRVVSGENPSSVSQRLLVVCKIETTKSNSIKANCNVTII